MDALFFGFFINKTIFEGNGGHFSALNLLASGRRCAGFVSHIHPAASGNVISLRNRLGCF